MISNLSLSLKGILIYRSNILYSLFGIILLSSIFLRCKSPENKELMIGTGGNTELIIVPENADEVVTMAASELQHYFQIITDKEQEELPE